MNGFRTRKVHSREFHVNTKARKKFSFEKSLFTLSGDLIVADLKTARKLSDKINKVRKKEQVTDKIVTPGQVNALGLMHEIFHYVMRYYEEMENPGVFARGVMYLKNKIGDRILTKTLHKYIEEFPPLAVYNNEVTPEEYLQGETEGKPNGEILIEELILLYLENMNPAFTSLKELFDSKPLEDETNYKTIMEETKIFFKSEKEFSLEKLSLLEAFEKVIITNPSNIEAQIGYFYAYWKVILKDNYLNRILSGADLIREDAKLFMQHGEKGTPPVPQFNFDDAKMKAILAALAEGRKGEFDDVDMSYAEHEHYTSDIEWMPKVVMLAKNIFVWLNQLSKKYQQDLYRLDHIPDAELDQLAKWNINALWLIGVWERSNASRKVKQFCGNPEAAPSAYSLYDYVIADQLGGEEAYLILKDKCNRRGIRLASDMVPNHTGIFSRWVLEHPDYFVQSDYPPYPGYSYTGPDLSDDGRYQIRIEDKYYSREDAAVVFQLIENESGRVRYIYHGNDGTNMPWNDTAQLNLLKPVVREALIQMIMHVARKFPIIRFDAAMTLSKKHYQRLWFPQPGTGGAIASRTDYGMTRKEFDGAMPNEFWREVVDRINAEMPETLLLAEAFWLMEGYFVRTLGMHRVYNSAFMHMFMKEENQKYRQLIKNTIDFDPEILKRYVNFMSNPDEETAINQFGKGDKYFGVAIMMITLPGLPMIGHGQIEGYTEKYGMEYYKAYYEEYPDEHLIKRHEYEVFPLLKKRYLFSEVYNFQFYDFVDDFNNVNENVFAFTNKSGNERTLVLYNNSYTETKGFIRHSLGKANKKHHGSDEKEMRYTDICNALELNTNDGWYYILRDHRTKLEYIRSGSELQNNGMRIYIGGYQYYVFLDFEEMHDVNGDLSRLHRELDGNGIPSVKDALYERTLRPLHTAVQTLCSKENVKLLKEAYDILGKKVDINELPDQVGRQVSYVINELVELKDTELSKAKTKDFIHKDYVTFSSLNNHILRLQEENKKADCSLLKKYWVLASSDKQAVYLDLLIMYVLIRRIILELRDSEKEMSGSALYESLLLHKPLWQSIIRLDNNYATVKQEFDLVGVLSSTNGLFVNTDSKTDSEENTDDDEGDYVTRIPAIELLQNKSVKKFIQYNVSEGVAYFNKEAFALLVQWEFSFEVIRMAEDIAFAYMKKEPDSFPIEKALEESVFCSTIIDMCKYADALLQFSDKVGYRYDDMIKEIKSLHKVAHDI